MTLNLKFLLLTAMAIIFIFLEKKFYNHAQVTRENEIKIQELKQENETKKKVIETKNQQQKLISNPTLSSDTAYRDRWVQLLWKKTDNLN